MVTKVVGGRSVPGEERACDLLAPPWSASSKDGLLGLVQGSRSAGPKDGRGSRRRTSPAAPFGALPSDPCLGALRSLNLDLSPRALTPALQHLMDLNLL